MWYWSGAGWADWLIVTVALLALSVFVVAGVMYLVQWNRRPTPTETLNYRSAEDILAARFAAGELGEDEYRHQLSVLQERKSRTSERSVAGRS